MRLVSCVLHSTLGETARELTFQSAVQNLKVLVRLGMQPALVVLHSFFLQQLLSSLFFLRSAPRVYLLVCLGFCSLDLQKLSDLEPGLDLPHKALDNDGLGMAGGLPLVRGHVLLALDDVVGLDRDVAAGFPLLGQRGWRTICVPLSRVVWDLWLAMSTVWVSRWNRSPRLAAWISWGVVVWAYAWKYSIPFFLCRYPPR